MNLFARIMPLEIVDENGNVHGPFTSRQEIDDCVASRGLGQERDDDDDSGLGWYLRAARTAR